MCHVGVDLVVDRSRDVQLQGTAAHESVLWIPGQNWHLQSCNMVRKAGHEVSSEGHGADVSRPTKTGE
jgi:hypothetical protein